MPPSPVYLIKFDNLKEERIHAANMEMLLEEIVYRMVRLGKPFEWIIKVYD